MKTNLHDIDINNNINFINLPWKGFDFNLEKDILQSKCYKNLTEFNFDNLNNS